ncbi:MAG: hypothetical protein FWH02_08055 [Oscillospiraceae bacterium]|nr:hypothetical protein [Oscillospiraceae bacterium]
MGDNFKEGNVFYLDREMMREQAERSRAELEETLRYTLEEQKLLAVTADALSQIEAVLIEMRTLASAAASGQNFDRALLDSIFQDKKRRIDDIAGGATYNGVNLLDGSLGKFSEIISAIADSFSSDGK